MIHVDPASTSPGAPSAESPTAQARALVKDQLATLTRLTQIGMDIAEACGREAQQAPNEAGLTFARVARAVRMTIALQSRLMKDLAALDRADDNARAGRNDRRRMRLRVLLGQAAGAAVDARIDAGQRYSGEDAIEDEIEHLAAEAYERLTDAEDWEFSDLSFDEVVAAVVKNLGVSPEWAARLRAVGAPPATPCEAPTSAPPACEHWRPGPAPPPDSGKIPPPPLSLPP